MEHQEFKDPRVLEREGADGAVRIEHTHGEYSVQASVLETRERDRPWQGVRALHVHVLA